MNVAAEEEPVGDEMLPAQRVRLDMGRLQYGQGVLPGDGAGPAIGRLHGDAEGALTEPGSDKMGGPETLGRLPELGERRSVGALEPLEAVSGQAGPLARGQIVGLALDHVRRPAFWFAHPFVGSEEDRLHQEDAADEVVAVRIRPEARGRASIVRDPRQHLGKVAGPIPLAERVPRMPCGNDDVSRENREAADGVPGALQPEEDELAG